MSTSGGSWPDSHIGGPHSGNQARWIHSEGSGRYNRMILLSESEESHVSVVIRLFSIKRGAVFPGDPPIGIHH